MDIRSNTTHKAAAKKSPAVRQNKKKRWGIKSCLAVFLAAIVTVTTVHSQVLYAHAENETAPDPRTRFTFLPLSSDQASITLDQKGTLAETLSKLPESLAVVLQEENTGSNPENPTPTVSDGNPAGNGEDHTEPADPDLGGQGAGDSSLDENSDPANDNTGEDTSDDTTVEITVPDTILYSAPEDTSAAIITSDGQASDNQTSDGSTSGGSTSDGKPSDGLASDGSTSDGLASDGSTSDSSTSDGSTSDNQTSDGQASDNQTFGMSASAPV